MKPLLNNPFIVGGLAMALLSLSACGQKGPLIVEKPPVETVTEQTQEPEDTK